MQLEMSDEALHKTDLIWRELKFHFTDRSAHQPSKLQRPYL